jgi:hypothetical protein
VLLLVIIVVDAVGLAEHPVTVVHIVVKQSVVAVDAPEAIAVLHLTWQSLAVVEVAQDVVDVVDEVDEWLVVEV